MNIFEACQVGDLDRVNILTREEGFDVNKFTHVPFIGIRSPLDFAIENGHLEIVKLLVKVGARVRVNKDCDQGGVFYSPLFPAIHRGDIEIVKVLIEAGCDVNESLNSYGFVLKYPPINFAIKNDHLEIVKLLLESGAKVDPDPLDIVTDGNSEFEPPLFHAIDDGNIEIVKLLISAGANVNRLNYGRVPQSPLRRAIYKEKIGIGEVLIEAGAKFRHGSEVPFSKVVLYDNIEDIKSFIDAGANVNEVFNLRHILYYAIRYRDIEVVKLLIKAGADFSVPNKRAHRERVLWMVATSGNKLDALDLLLSLPNEKFDHREALKLLCHEFACKDGHQDQTRHDLSKAIKRILQHPNFPKDFDFGVTEEVVDSVDEIYVGNEAIKSVVGSLYGSDRKNISLPLLEYLLERQKNAGVDLVEVLNEHETFDRDFEDAELEDRSGIDYGATQETLFVTACAKGRPDVAGLLHRYGADPKIKVMGRSAFALTLMQANNDFLALQQRLQPQPVGEAGEATDADEVVEISSPEQIIAKYLPSLSLILSVDHSFNPFDLEQNLPFGCENSYDFMQQLNRQGLNILDPLLNKHALLKEYILSSEKEKKQDEEIKKLQEMFSQFMNGRSGKDPGDETAGHGAPKSSPSPGLTEGQVEQTRRRR